MKKYIHYFIPTFFFFSCLPAFAQSPTNTASLWQRGISYEAGWQEMYSTHNNFFHGFDAEVGYRFSPRFKMGAGVEFSFTHFHETNNWNLTNLRFLPIFISEQFDLRKKGNLRPFIRLKQGITPTTYLWDDAFDPGIPHRITEAGLYLSGSFGLTQKITNHVGIIGEVGLKGFQMSFNAYDVNPHGVIFRLGLIYAK